MSDSSSSSSSTPTGGAATTTTNNPTSSYNGTAAATPNHNNTPSDPSSSSSSSSSNLANQVLDKRRLQELVKEVDPHEQLDEDVEDLLLHIADDFIEQTVSQAAQLARHRKAQTIDVRDVQLVLERNWNMWIPGFGTEDIRSHKRSATTEAHKSRMALIRKTLKKY